MQRNIYLLLTAILLIGILVSGAQCTPVGKKNVKEEAPGTMQLKNIRSGTDALVMDFVKNVPPDQIYDTDVLTVAVNLRNRGAESIEDAWFYLGGFDKNIIPFDVEGIPLSETGADYIPGKDELRGEEGETAITFSAQLGQGGEGSLPEGTDVYEANIIMTACYPYRTVANLIVCIDSNPFGVYTSSKACVPKVVSDLSGQGGPIAVTSVDQAPMRGKVQFKIYISNKGKGKAISVDKYSTCNQIESSDYKYINMIDSYSVEASGLGEGKEGKCQPDYENLRLVDDKAVIICSFDIDEAVPAYTTPLNIILNYHYMESTLPKKVRILHI
jgi:hypothetical protein